MSVLLAIPPATDAFSGQVQYVPGSNPDIAAFVDDVPDRPLASSLYETLTDAIAADQLKASDAVVAE